MANMFEFAIALKLLDNASRGLRDVKQNVEAIGTGAQSAQRRFDGAFGGMIRKASELGDKLKQTAARIKEAGDAAQLGAVAMGGAVGKAVSSFKDLEAAETNLRVAMMGKGGIVDTEQFEKMSALAQQLGIDYMGSTEDFYKMFRVLYEQGMSSEKILGGVGKAVADFAAVTGESYTESALKISKFQDSLGIAATDMVKFSELASKAKFAFGLDTTEIYYALPYMSAGLKSLGLQGVEASNDVLKLIGVLSQAGLPASEVGTSVGQLVNRMADFENRLGKSSKQMAQVREALAGTGIEMKFFDERGKFAGFENMIAQFQKLNALDPQKRLQVMKQLFGDVAGRAVSILGEKGIAGWTEAEVKMQQQANLMERMGAIQGTLAFKWDSFTGTVRLFASSVGDAINRCAGLKTILEKLNDVFGYAANWIKEHQTLASAIAGVLVVATALTVGVATLGGAIMIGTSVLSAFRAGMLAVRAVTLFTAGAMKTLFLTLVTNPIGLIALAIAGAAFLIYTYWGPISAFFSRIWEGIKAGIKSLEPAFSVIFALPMKMIAAGQNIINSLWAGMQSMIDKPVELLKSLVTKLRNMLPFSPAKEGPLADIHRVRLIETIAETVRPEPMIKALRATMAAAVIAIPPVMPTVTAAANATVAPIAAQTQKITQVLEPAKILSPKSASAGGGMVVNFSPTINIQGGEVAKIQAAVEQANQLSIEQLEKMIARVNAQIERRKF